MYVCGSSGYRPADTRLHLAIADAAGSPMLTASVVEARVQLVDLLNAIPMLGRNLEHANVQHAGIVRAILAGDPDRARRAMEEHVAGTAALLRGFLEVLARGDDPPEPPASGGKPSPQTPLALTRSLARWVNTFIQWITSIHMCPVPPREIAWPTILPPPRRRARTSAACTNSATPRNSCDACPGSRTSPFRSRSSRSCRAA